MNVILNNDISILRMSICNRYFTTVVVIFLSHEKTTSSEKYSLIIVHLYIYIYITL